MYDLSWWLPCALDTKYSVSIQSNRLMVFSILSIYFFFLFILPITEMWVKIRRKNNSLRIPGVCWYVRGRVHSRSSPLLQTLPFTSFYLKTWNTPIRDCIVLQNPVFEPLLWRILALKSNRADLISNLLPWQP